MRWPGFMEFRCLLRLWSGIPHCYRLLAKVCLFSVSVSVDIIVFATNSKWCCLFFFPSMIRYELSSTEIVFDRSSEIRNRTSPFQFGFTIIWIWIWVSVSYSSFRIAYTQRIWVFFLLPEDVAIFLSLSLCILIMACF